MNDLLQLMHDTMGATASIKSIAQILKTHDLSPEERMFMLDSLEKKANELNTALDGYYPCTLR